MQFLGVKVLRKWCFNVPNVPNISTHSTDVKYLLNLNTLLTSENTLKFYEKIMHQIVYTPGCLFVDIAVQRYVIA